MCEHACISKHKNSPEEARGNRSPSQGANAPGGTETLISSSGHVGPGVQSPCWLRTGSQTTRTRPLRDLHPGVANRPSALEYTWVKPGWSQALRKWELLRKDQSTHLHQLSLLAGHFWAPHGKGSRAPREPPRAWAQPVELQDHPQNTVGVATGPRSHAPAPDQPFHASGTPSTAALPFAGHQAPARWCHNPAIDPAGRASAEKWKMRFQADRCAPHHPSAWRGAQHSLGG